MHENRRDVELLRVRLVIIFTRFFFSFFQPNRPSRSVGDSFTCTHSSGFPDGSPEVDSGETSAGVARRNAVWETTTTTTTRYSIRIRYVIDAPHCFDVQQKRKV